MDYALLLEKGRVDFRFRTSENDRPSLTQWKESMKEDKCFGENGIVGSHEDERIKCDRKAHKNGKCFYHLLIDKRSMTS